MAQTKPNDTAEGECVISGRIRERDGSETGSDRAIGSYSYRLVYSQESIRMLDMRLDISELAKPEDIRKLLTSVGERILEEQIRLTLRRLLREELEELK